MCRINPPNDLPRFFMLKSALGHYTSLGLPGRVKIRVGEMQRFEQGMTAAALLRRRPGERLQALVKRVIPRGNSFHVEGKFRTEERRRPAPRRPLPWRPLPAPRQRRPATRCQTARALHARARTNADGVRKARVLATPSNAA